MPDYYSILGVTQSATGDEIRRAYRTLARQCHPDVSGDHTGERFRQIFQAYETLSDEQRRREYDRQRSRPRPPARWTDLAHDWFSDEVAIDFPSIRAVVDRIREAFLGPEDQRRWLSAEVLLSPEEAISGSAFLVHVPIRQTCATCGGRGESWMERCSTCLGTGHSTHRFPLQVSLPPGVRHGDRFRFRITPRFDPVDSATMVELRIAIR